MSTSATPASNSGITTITSYDSLARLFRRKGFLDQFDVVSFDVFDTLLFRRCAPDIVLKNVFRALENRLTAAGCRPRMPIDAARDQAYRNLAQKQAAAGNDFDTRLEDLIPEWLSLVVGRDHPDRDRLIHYLLETEIAYENASIYPNERMRQVLACCQGKVRTIIVSDMYLGAAIVERLLASKDIGPFDAAYVSGDHSLLKRSGRLFQYILERENVPPSRILHIGDDPHADGKMAAANGLSALVLSIPEERQRISLLTTAGKDFSRGKPLAPGRVVHLFARNGVNTLPATVNFGLQVLGPILVPFVHRLAERCHDEKISRVYFMAREGFLLKKLFDQLAPTILSPAAVPASYYLCVSRLPTFLASVRTLGLRELRYCLANTSGTPTLRRILAPFGLPEDLLRRSAQRAGIADIDGLLAPPGCRAEELFRLSQLQNLRNDPELRRAITTVAVAHHKGLAGYLDSLHFFAPGEAALVDVGWSGQIQDNLYQAFHRERVLPRLWGFYLGTRETTAFLESEHCRYEGLLADLARPCWCGTAAFDFVQLFEAVTRAPHGTVIGYREQENGCFVPLLKPDSAASRQAEIRDEPLLSGFQKGVLLYAQAYGCFVNMAALPATSLLPYARKMTARLVRYPTDQEVDWLCSLANVSDLGSDEVVRLGGDPVMTGGRQSLKTRLAVLRNSRWKYGTAKQVGMDFLRPLLACYQGVRFNNRYHGVPRRKSFERPTGKQSNTTAEWTGDTYGEDLMRDCSKLMEAYASELANDRPLCQHEDMPSLRLERTIFSFVQLARLVLGRPPFIGFL